jgi:hypothetical protein
MARSNDWSSSTRCKSGVLNIAHEDVWNVRYGDYYGFEPCRVCSHVV